MTRNQSKHWNGKSTYKLSEALQKAAELGRAKFLVVQQLDTSIREFEDTAKQEAAKLLGNKSPADHKWLYLSWSIECPGSPIGTCIYDTYEDPMKDQCIICDEPADRG